MVDVTLPSGMSRYRPRIGTGLYAHVVDVLGQEIIDGDLKVGEIVHADQLCERFVVSRSVIREGIRALSSMGLVEARPQVGTRILPPAQWDLLNPQVVRWRARGPRYIEQMQELLELRLGIEHVAAGLAARRIGADRAAEMMKHAERMREAFNQQDARTFFEADAAFHRTLLHSTDNAVITQLAETIGATLEVRINDTRPGMHFLTEESVNKHISLAQALVDADVAEAQRMALALVEQTLHEFEELHPGSRSA